MTTKPIPATPLPVIDWRVRKIVRWLRAEGALSASVALPGCSPVTVYRSERVRRTILRDLGESE